MNTDGIGYIRDLFNLVREAAAEARREKENAPATAGYQEAREMAFVEALLLMQSQARAFMIPLEAVGMDGFDPLNDALAPPNVSRDK